MKQIIAVFLILLSIFFICWGVKANTLVKRPDNIEDGKITPWYESTYTAPNEESEWYIDPDIPDDYIKVPGKDDIYMVMKNGVIDHYVKRVPAKGRGYDFIAYNPDIPETYEKVDGLEDVYKVTDEKGNVSYKKYVRNKDDQTFAFVDVDENGNYLNLNNDATTIDDKHKLVDSNENLYALYNENNVKIGYQKRVKDKDGKFKWINAEAPKKKEVGNNGIKNRASNNTEDTSQYVDKPAPIDDSKIINSDGSYVVTSKNTNVKTVDGYKIRYETTTKTTYAKDGSVLHMETSDPVQVSKEKITGANATPDPSKIENTLDKELSRVSAKVSYNTDKASQVLSKLNAARKSEGANALKMDTSSDLYKIAKIRAADMALYNHGQNNSPMYGKPADMCKRFGLNYVNITQIAYKGSEKSASEIHTTNHNTDQARPTRVSTAYGQVAIAIVDQDGMTYEVEVYAQ